ncbi:MAG: hypothetical protein GX605_01525 [Chloroflexi bacterium]|nr:hypothetical protein [Chloroflexota bacterium]
MDKKRRSDLAGGLVLVLLGLAFLAGQLLPGLADWLQIEASWPLIVVAVGGGLLLIGLVTGVPDMAVPACLVGGIGLLLYWQNATGNWASWAYAWALIPGFAGVGVILRGLLNGETADGLREGGSTILVSLIMFAIFASFLGGPNWLQPYWPVLLIVLGVWMLVRPVLRPKAK